LIRDDGCCGWAAADRVWNRFARSKQNGWPSLLHGRVSGLPFAEIRRTALSLQHRTRARQYASRARRGGWADGPIRRPRVGPWPAQGRTCSAGFPGGHGRAVDVGRDGWQLLASGRGSVDRRTGVARPSHCSASGVRSGPRWPGFLRGLLERLRLPQAMSGRCGFVAGSNGDLGVRPCRNHPGRTAATNPPFDRPAVHRAGPCAERA